MPASKRLNKAERALKEDIESSLISQGFRINPHLRPPKQTKRAYRKVQTEAKRLQIKSYKEFLSGFAKSAQKYSADGRDIDPNEISLELREVKPGTFKAHLFRWWNLVWWSMPYQKAYGRQMRFFLWDVSHGLPFGLFILQSPLLRLTARDEYLRLDKDSLDYWANMSMSAQRVGALPPYNELIGGKMSALAMTSNEVRRAYRKKYEGRATLMEGRVLKPDLLFVTTSSAFGKSSMYDRLRYGGRDAALYIGETKGNGTFHMPDDMIGRMYAMLQRHDVDTKTSFGHGPSRKLKLTKRSLQLLGLSGFHQHGVKRGVYLFPLARNLDNVIHKGKRPVWYDRPFDDLAEFWKRRWAVPRSERTSAWKEFDSGKFFRGVRSSLAKAG